MRRGRRGSVPQTPVAQTQVQAQRALIGLICENYMVPEFYKPLMAGQVTLFWTSDRRFAKYLQNEARVDWVKTGF